METNNEKLLELLENAKQAYYEEKFADAFNFAQDAFKIDKYNPEVYMYRAFSHLWYAALTEDSLYEQSILDDVNIVLDIAYEDGETKKYYKLCEFCNREMLHYYLFLMHLSLEEFENIRKQVGPMTDEEYNQAVNENLSAVCIPIEEAVEMLWEYAIFSKISDLNACSDNIFTDSIDFIEKYMEITSRYAFYDAIDKFQKIIDTKQDGSYTPSKPEEYDIKKYINSRKAYWIRHKTLLRGAAEERISIWEKELSELEFKKKNEGLFSFGKKKQLQTQIDAKAKEIVFMKNGMLAEVAAVDKLLTDLDDKISALE